MTIRQKLAALIDPNGAALAKADRAAVESLSHRLRLSHANEELGNRQAASATSAATANANRVDVLMAALKRATPYVKEARGALLDNAKRERTKKKRDAITASAYAVSEDLNAIMDALFPKKFAGTVIAPRPPATGVIELDGVKFGQAKGPVGKAAKNDSVAAPTVA